MRRRDVPEGRLFATHQPTWPDESDVADTPRAPGYRVRHVFLLITRVRPLARESKADQPKPGWNATLNRFMSHKRITCHKSDQMLSNTSALLRIVL
jgi:hypothetical protein